MPDIRNLYDFLSRTQKHMKYAMDNGDEQAVNQYENFMDRANAVAQRSLGGGNQGGAPNDFWTGNDNDVVGPPSPALQAPQDANYMAGDDPPQQNNANVPASPPMPVQSPFQTVQPKGQVPFTLPPEAGKAYADWAQGQQTNVDVPSLNQPSGQSLKVDLANETNPMQVGKIDITGHGTLRGGVPPGQEETPWSKSSNPFKHVAGEFGDWVTKPITPPAFESNGSGYVKGTGEANQWSKEKAPQDSVGPTQLTPDNPFQDKGEMSADEMKQYRYDNSDTKTRFDNMTKEIAGAKAKAQDPYEAEFLKRVEREVGDKPSFFSFETLAKILLLGAPKAYQDYQNDKSRYQSGKLAVAHGMHQEAMQKTAMDARQAKATLDKSLEEKKAFYALLPHAIGQAQKPHLVAAERLSAELDTILRNPATADNDPRLAVLRNQYQAELDQAQAISDNNYKGIVK